MSLVVPSKDKVGSIFDNDVLLFERLVFDFDFDFDFDFEFDFDLLDLVRLNQFLNMNES